MSSSAPGGTGQTPRVAFLTGASGGLGRALARTLVGHGFNVALAARNASRLDDLVTELGNDAALAVSMDVAQWDQVVEAVAAVVGRWGGIDVVVANAGVAGKTSFLGEEGVPPADWSAMIDANLLGTALTAKATMPHLLERSGQLIITGSVAGVITRPGSLYSVTKWAVAQLAETIRSEVAGSGVRVGIVHPGMIDTDLLRAEHRGQPALDPDGLAAGFMGVIESPYDINEIVIRPPGAAH